LKIHQHVVDFQSNDKLVFVIVRSLEPILRAALDDTPAVILHGPRQSGKTTLVKALASGKNRIPHRYVTLDDALTLELATRDPAGFVANLPDHVIIDEIQLAPRTFRSIKQSIDDNRKPGRFILTGSANALLIPQLSNTLVGRSEIHTLLPLSQSEIEGAPGKLIDRLFQGGVQNFVGQRYDLTRLDLIKRLMNGGFPEVIARRQKERKQIWFDSYVVELIQRDIRDLSNIEGLTILPRVLGLLAGRAANLWNLADLSRTIGVPQTTLKRYLALFEATFLIHTLPAWSGKFSKRLTKTSKLMTNDTGLLCHLLGIDEDRLLADPFRIGPILENFVFVEIKKQSTWSDTSVQLMHFRTHQDDEVDLVLEKRNGEIVAIETKAAASFNSKDCASLERLRDELGRKFVAGLILYTGSQVLPVSDRIIAAPISILWQT
jgi:predicted AAA+ superfamily ATPase